MLNDAIRSQAQAQQTSEMQKQMEALQAQLQQAKAQEQDAQRRATEAQNDAQNRQVEEMKRQMEEMKRQLEEAKAAPAATTERDPKIYVKIFYTNPRTGIELREYDDMRESDYLALKGDYKALCAFVSGKYRDGDPVTNVRIERWEQ